VIVFAMLLMIALALVLVDGGHAFVEKRSLQNAADAASLAAAAQLTPGMACTGVCLVNVKNTAEQYLVYNGVNLTLHFCDVSAVPADTNCYLTPYNGDNGLVQIRLSRSIDTFFGGAVGVGSIDISARAASRATAVTAATTIPGTTQSDQTVYNTDTSTNIDNGTTSYSTTTTASTTAGTAFEPVGCINSVSAGRARGRPVGGEGSVGSPSCGGRCWSCRSSTLSPAGCLSWSCCSRAASARRSSRFSCCDTSCRSCAGR